MIRPSTLARTIAVAFGFVVAFGVTAPAANASEFPSDPSATAVEQCDNLADPLSFIGAQWHVQIANSDLGKDVANFVVIVGNGAPQKFALQPGNNKDLVIKGLDGLPSHIVITADGKGLVDTITTAHCNDPVTSMYFQCKGPYPLLPVSTLNYEINNDTDKTVDFDIHHANGSVQHETRTSMEGVFNAYHEVVNEGDAYDVWIDVNGLEGQHLTGVVDCDQDPPPPPPIAQGTPPPADPPPADPPPVAPPVTVVGHDTSAPPLARTGADTLPLTGIGFSLIGLGVLALRAQRRRLATL
jgi:hypothetical protein